MTFEHRSIRVYIRIMKRFAALSLSLAIVASPATSQEVVDEEGAGKSLMEQGAELFLKGLQQEMEPTLDDLRGLALQFGPSMHAFLAEMGPALAELVGEVRDWSAYEAPEILPNGDIIIRRKPEPDPPEDLPEPKLAPDGAIEL